MKLSFYILIFFCLFTCACAQNFYPSKPVLRLPDEYEPVEAYIENPELVTEYMILKNSGLYRIIDNPDVELHIRLEKSEHYGMCGMGIILSAGTLGIIPHCISSDQQFRYKTIVSEVVNNYQYTLNGKYCESVWENFRKETKTDEELLGGMLRTEVIAKMK